MRALTELDVYAAGELTVVGFGGREILDELSIVGRRDEILELIEAEGCTTLAIDLTGVLLMPGGLLGLLDEIHRAGVEILLYNASDDIRQVLEIADRGDLVQLYEVDV